MATIDTIKTYIQSLEAPVSREAIYSHFKKNPKITRGTVSAALKELGYSPNRHRTGEGLSGIQVLWAPKEEPETVSDESSETVEDEPKTDADVLTDVEQKNERDSTVTARLFDALAESRSLREEMIKRQTDTLLTLCRSVLSLLGDADEQKRYRP